MHQQLRRGFTLGAAVTGAAVIATAPLPTAPRPIVPSFPVALTSGADALFHPWQQVFDDAKGNVDQLLPALDDAQDRFTAALTPPIAAGSPTELFDGLTFLDGPYYMFRNSLAHWTLDGTATDDGEGGLGVTGHIPLYLVLTGQLDQPAYGLTAPAEPIPTLANLLVSPLSAVPLGIVSPVIAPLVGLLNTVEAAGADLTGPGADPLAALQELLGAPANMLGGFLNGATLNLDGLVPLFQDLLPLPGDTDLTHLSYAFGGLLSPGETVNGAGGSLFNAVGMDLTGIPVGGSTLDLNVVGQGIGPFGALITLEQDLAFLLNYPVGEIPEELPPLPDALDAADLGWFPDFTG